MADNSALALGAVALFCLAFAGIVGVWVSSELQQRRVRRDRKREQRANARVLPMASTIDDLGSPDWEDFGDQWVLPDHWSAEEIYGPPQHRAPATWEHTEHTDASPVGGKRELIDLTKWPDPERPTDDDLIKAIGELKFGVDAADVESGQLWDYDMLQRSANTVPIDPAYLPGGGVDGRVLPTPPARQALPQPVLNPPALDDLLVAALCSGPRTMHQLCQATGVGRVEFIARIQVLMLEQSVEPFRTADGVAYRIKEMRR